MQLVEKWNRNFIKSPVLAASDTVFLYSRAKSFIYRFHHADKVAFGRYLDYQ